MPNVVQIIFNVDPNGLGQAALNQINQSVGQIGQTSQQSGAQVDTFLKAFKIALVVDFLKDAAKAAFDFGKAAVEAFNQANNAALGLQSVAKFKGLDPKETLEQVKNLDLVKSGLLTIGDASTTLKNLLQAGFGLEQSIELIKRFGDSAAFGKQSALTFGQAVVSTSEGIRNQNSILSDNGGITKNLSVILRERGFELQDLSDKVKGAAAREALYNGLLKETAAQVGDAAKLTQTFAGGQAQLEAAQQKVLVTVGKLITENPALQDSFKELGKSLEIVNNILRDSDSQLSQLVQAGTTTFAALVRGSADLLSSLEGVLGLVRDISAAVTLGGSEFFFKKLFPEDDEATKRVLEGAKKFREAFDAATKTKPDSTPDTEKPLKSDKAGLAAFLRFVKEGEALRKKFLESVSNAGDSILGLQSRLQHNPLVEFYNVADARQKEFFEKFKDIPAGMIEQYKKVNSQVLALDLFRGGLSQASLLNNLILERDKLQAGLGGKSQLTEAQQLRLAQLQKASLDTQLATAQKFAASAANPLQRNLANEQIISATSDISKLTPEQVDIRLKALNDSIGFQQQIAKENFDRAQKESQSREENTFALVQVGNRLAAVEGALTNFAQTALTIKIENESVASVDLGRSFRN
jgi:hypothetical protein